jgi:hypothetical protein
MKKLGGSEGLRPPSRPMRVPSYGPADAAAPTAATRKNKFCARHEIYSCLAQKNHYNFVVEPIRT